MPLFSVMWGVKGVGVEIWLSLLRLPVELGCQRVTWSQSRVQTPTPPRGKLSILAVGSGREGAS